MQTHWWGRAERAFVQAGWLVPLHLNGWDSITSHQVSIKINYGQTPSIASQGRRQAPSKSQPAYSQRQRVTVRPNVTFIPSNLQILLILFNNLLETTKREVTDVISAPKSLKIQTCQSRREKRGSIISPVLCSHQPQPFPPLHTPQALTETCCLTFLSVWHPMFLAV